MFKPLDEMKWKNTKRGPYCTTMCKRCHNRLNSRPHRQRSDEHNERRRRYRIAWRRALGRLANRHQEELRALVKEELRAIGSDQVVDLVVVSQHIRRVYGRADEAAQSEGGP